MRFLGFGMWRIVRLLKGYVKSEIGKPSAPDISESDKSAIMKVMPFTQTSMERVYAIITAIRYIEKAGISGSVVECGVWRGGSVMAALNALLELGSQGREIYLFDTFEGMTEPGVEDIAITGETAAEEFKRETSAGESWNCVSLDAVKDSVLGTGYLQSKIHFKKGRVEETLPSEAPAEIALLRLDTDWYESTRHELVHLFPRLVSGGVIIIDDYGHYSGAKRAVDEYIDENGIKLLLCRIDYTGRIGVKI